MILKGIRLWRNIDIQRGTYQVYTDNPFRRWRQEFLSFFPHELPARPAPTPSQLTQPVIEGPVLAGLEREALGLEERKISQEERKRTEDEGRAREAQAIATRQQLERDRPAREEAQRLHDEMAVTLSRENAPRLPPRKGPPS